MGSVSKNTRILVAERDNWVCAICQAEIPESTEDPYDPVSLNADHIISQRDGGTHDLTNLRATHRFCNTSRGAGDEDWKYHQDAYVYLCMRVQYPEIGWMNPGKKTKTFFHRPEEISRDLEFTIGKDLKLYLVVRHDHKNRRILRRVGLFR